MTLTEDIKNLITELQLLPNSEWRNKTISHLKDALACAAMTSYVATNDNLKSYGPPECNCAPGMVDTQWSGYGAQKRKLRRRHLLK